MNQHLNIDTIPLKEPNTQVCNNYMSALDDALYVIGGKWKLRIITGLLDEPKRFNILQRTVKGISATVLSHELKELELNGFLTRVVHDTTPVSVEYQLTDYSLTLSKVVEELAKWGIMHRQTIKNR